MLDITGKDHLLRLALPIDGNPPSLSIKMSANRPVSTPISTQLIDPPLSISLRNGCPRTRSMLIPETTVDEYNQIEFSNHEVRLSPYTFNIRFISDPLSLQTSSYGLLRGSILLSYLGHPGRGAYIHIYHMTLDNKAVIIQSRICVSHFFAETSKLWPSHKRRRNTRTSTQQGMFSQLTSFVRFLREVWAEWPNRFSGLRQSPVDQYLAVNHAIMPMVAKALRDTPCRTPPPY